MADIIFHHYPQSPVSEKVRVGLGIKGLAWHSVTIPRLPPKPDLMPLTGGYRRTPVMQIGADIYCDSRCILRELERRFPEPTLFPGGGLDWGISRWTDIVLFDLCIRLVFGAGADDIPADFAADRGRLYLGKDWNLAALADDLAHTLVQLRAQLGWLDQTLASQALASGPGYLSGVKPGLADALVYHLIWFVRGRWDGGPEFLSQFPSLEDWERRVDAIGHGEATEMDSGAALDIAKSATTTTPEQVDGSDAQGLSIGQSVGVTPDEDGGDPVVHGTVRYVDADTVGVICVDDRVGEVCVHFPRVGYRVIPA